MEMRTGSPSATALSCPQLQAAWRVVIILLRSSIEAQATARTFRWFESPETPNGLNSAAGARGGWSKAETGAGDLSAGAICYVLFLYSSIDLSTISVGR